MTQNLNKKLLLLVFSFFVMLHQVMAQSKTITGKIIDEKDKPVPGVSITVKGSPKGTSTDASGAFSISVPSTSKMLIVSAVGYTEQELNIESETNLKITLRTAAATALNDVVVVGYGTARKKDVTGAVSSISAKGFNQGIISTPMDQVQGRVPGLVITKPDGDPNSNPVIRLRGQTSLYGSQAPLLVVDGIILDNYEVLSSIPPADIVSYDFLKDASAASIYGSRGANGVIIITTKKGHSGNIQVEYNGSFSAAHDAKYYDLLNAKEYLAQATKLGFNAASLDQGGNTDWQKAITRTGYTNTHNIGLSGGTGGFTYHGSLDYQNQQGIVINNGNQRLGLRLDMEQKALNNKLDILVNVLNTEVKRQNVDANIFYWAYNINPTIPEFVNGKDNPIYNYNYLNPVWMQNNELKQETDYLKQINVTVNYDIFKGLKAGATGNISRYNVQYDYYLPNIPGANGGILNQGFKYNSNTNSNKGDFHINYGGSFGKNNISATAVYEYNYYEDDFFSASGKGYLTDITQNNSLGSGIATFNSIASYKEEYKLISFLGRVTYNYDQRYYLTGSIRRDGSSKFGFDNQQGYFPAVSAAWRISQEKFLKNVNWLDELKINAGYGVTGNSDPIGAYNTQLLLGTIANGQVVHVYDPTNPSNPFPVGYTPSQNPNSDLKWEKRIGKNIGMEYSLMKSRVSGSFSYFSDKTENMLFNYGVQVPPNFINSVLANVGSMTNKGVEFGINVDIIRKKDFGWSVGGQISTVRTRVSSLSGTWQGNAVSSNHIQLTAAGGQGLSFNPLTYLQVGYFPSVFFLPHYVGHDAAGNQLLDSAGVKGLTLAQNQNPTYYYTDPSPKFTYGFNTTVRYKNFAFSAAFTGNHGQKIYDNTRLNMANYQRFPGLNTLKEAFTNGLKDGPTTSDYWLEKASYLRCQSMTIAYTFPKLAGIENLRFYISGNNLFTITPYKGLDPEISPNGSGTGGFSSANGSRANISSLATSLSSNYGGLGGAGSGLGYVDNNYAGRGFYPRARTFTIGVSITVK